MMLFSMVQTHTDVGVIVRAIGGTRFLDEYLASLHSSPMLHFDSY
jgi:hypothetical protein